jgi:probable HAF family extracellular repeat protein
MIDLGVLVDPKPECAYGVNSSGKVVGTVPSWGPPLAFLWSRQYGVKYLGTLGEVEQSFSMANDINDRGQVVGVSWEPGTTAMRAVLWSDNGGMVNLGTSGDPSVPPMMKEDAYSYAFGLNNRGEIVGNVCGYAFLWTDRRGMVLLCSPQYRSTAWDINDNGWIVGISNVWDPVINSTEKYHAVLWTDVGVMLDLDLGTLKLNSQALGINNRGEIVGVSSDHFITVHELIDDEFDHSCVAFIWTKQNGMSQLPMLGGDAGSAHAINDRGQVVGWSYTVANKVHAFVWTSKNGIKDLGTLPGDAVQESVAYNINNLGQVVGYSIAEDGTRHAVIWTVR